MRSLALLLVVVVCALGISPAVVAEEELRDPSPADRATARNLMDLGDQKAAGGDYVGALEAYAAADAIMRVPTTGIELGKVQAKLGRLVEAADTLLRVARHPQAADEPIAFTRARKEASRMAPEIIKRTPTITITVEGLPDGAKPHLRIDNATVPARTIGLPHKVNPGTHHVAVGTPGWIGNQEVTVAEGEHQDVVVKLEQGEAPPDFYEDADTWDESAESTGISPVVWVGFGVGAAGLVVGTITGIAALSERSDLDTACPNMDCAPAAQEDLDSAYTLAHVSTVGFIVAGVGTSVALIALLAGGAGDDSTSARRGWHVVPVVAPGGLGLRGTF